MFGFRAKKKEPELDILMDRNSHVLAKAEVQGEPNDTNVQVKVMDGLTDKVVQAEIVQLVSPDADKSVILGRVILRRGNLVTLEPLRKLGAAVRKHFRMPVAFESYLYPRSGGRAIMRSIDLSCGGIAFYSAASVGVGDDPEIVIPITLEAPLIMPCQILRVMPYNGPIQQFAAQFVDVIHDQEAMIQEAVFRIQVESIQISRNRKR